MEDAVSGLMKSANKLSAYRANAVSSATPENLVVMMYDGAIRFLGAAIRAFEGWFEPLCSRPEGAARGRLHSGSNQPEGEAGSHPPEPET